MTQPKTAKTATKARSAQRPDPCDSCPARDRCKNRGKCPNRWKGGCGGKGGCSDREEQTAARVRDYEAPSTDGVVELLAAVNGLTMAIRQLTRVLEGGPRR